MCDRSMYLSLTTNRILLHWILILPPLYKVMVLLWKCTQQRCFVMAKRITVLTPTIPCSEQSPQHEQVAHAQLPGLISLDMPASLQTSEEISVKHQPVAHAHTYTTDFLEACRASVWRFVSARVFFFFFDQIHSGHFRLILG